MLGIINHSKTAFSFRYLFAAGRHKQMPRICSMIHIYYQTPIHAIIIVVSKLMAVYYKKIQFALESLYHGTLIMLFSNWLFQGSYGVFTPSVTRTETGVGTGATTIGHNMSRPLSQFNCNAKAYRKFHTTHLFLVLVPVSVPASVNTP